MVEIATSILTMKKGEEANTILNLEVAKTDYFHIDVMDGKFVQKDTYQRMLENASYIKRVSNLPLDVHFMVEDIETAIQDFADLEPNVMTFHLEACKDKETVKKYIKMIQEKHCKVGISIKPNTPVEEVYEFLPYIHQCLIMTVEPGKGGQTFLTQMVEKIKRLKEYIQEKELEVDIEVDGGINLKTAPVVKKAGANILVAGTAILMANNYKTIIDELKANI